ncbi:hypothetical protein B0H21DRAFT_735346 [Amylocystis lapponica]|nr:hypothetical protein B0H21DRAFT_735346 [Amylocystis lapponica]
MCEKAVQATLLRDLADSSTSTVAELQPCGQDVLASLRDAAEHLGQHSHIDLDRLIAHAYTNLKCARTPLRCWRRLYSDSSILRSVADVHALRATTDDTIADLAIARLDHCIIVAGAPGEGRLDLIIDFIKGLQTEWRRYVPPLTSSIHLSLPPPHRAAAPLPRLTTSSNAVPRLHSPPSLSSFISRHSRQPFIIPGHLLDWPALNEHPWRSLDYLRAVAGPGRVVPVEVGSDYREDSWTQKMMAWNDFLNTLATRSPAQDGQPLTYLAQHNLFAQFPELRADIIVPDYVYASLAPPADYPVYAPPTNDEQLVLNVWLGPQAQTPARCPAHAFPAQVVGRKTVWLAPPRAAPAMYAYPPPSRAAADQPRNPAENTTAPSMTNTSQVDVFASQRDGAFPAFWEGVVCDAMDATLEAGDLLFFPPGWWHAMRTEETSFSVSMWF